MAVAISQTANPAGVSASGNISTYSSVAIGTASTDRIIAVVVGTELASSTPSACTIDSGGGDVAMTAGTTGNFGAMFARIFYLNVKTGTTATIKVTYSSTNPLNTENHIAVYAVTGAYTILSAEGGDGSSDMDVTDPLTTGSTTIPTSGGMIAIAAGASDTDAKAWSNLTEDIDADAGTFRFTTATSLSAGTATRTCTGGVNGEDGALSYVIFNPVLTIQVKEKIFVAEPSQDVVSGATDTTQVYGGTAGAGETSQGHGQSFVATNTSLRDIQVFITKTGAPADSLVMNVTTSIGGTSLATKTLTAASISSGDYNRFTFDSPLALTVGTRYFVQLTRTGARDTSNYYVPRIDFQSTTYGSMYPGESLYVLSNTAWSTDSTVSHMMLKLNYTLTPTTSLTTPKTATFSDNFNDNNFGTDWTVAGGEGNESNTGGMVRMVLPSGLFHYGTVDSLGNYDLTASYSYSQLVEDGNFASQNDRLFVQPLFLYRDDAGFLESLSWNIEGDVGVPASLVAQYDTGSASPTDVWTDTYDPAVHKWFRIREASGTIFWDTSVDGVTWTNRTSVATPAIDITSLQIELYADSDGAVSHTVRFDNYNFPLNNNISVSDSVTVAESNTLLLTSRISVFDTVTATEFRSLSFTSNISVSDSVSLIDAATVFIALFGVNRFDTVTVAESIALELNNRISAVDTISVTENRTVEVQRYIDFETITVTEHVKIDVSTTWIDRSAVAGSYTNRSITPSVWTDRIPFN